MQKTSRFSFFIKLICCGALLCTETIPLEANQNPEFSDHAGEKSSPNISAESFSRVKAVQGSADHEIKKVSFYVVAHQDDWQLFMNPSPFHEVLDPDTRVVFIYLTAGDAGRKSGPVTNPFFVARNNGARQAVKFMVGSVDSSGNLSTEKTTLNGHTIEKSILKNSVSYFLNLPDGNFDGEGFESTGWSSLKNLHSRKLKSLSAVDDSSIYKGWKDLIKTLDALIRYETKDKDLRSVTINIQDTDENLNKFDHSDHFFTGVAMLTVAKKYPEFQVRAFLDYVTKDMPINLAEDEILLETGAFAATTGQLIQSGYPSTWDKRHRKWLGRNYFRVIQNGEATKSFLSRLSGLLH